MSALLRAQRKPDEDANRYLTISLEPSDRAALHARIEQRFDAMLAQGLIDEVRARARAATCIPACPRCAAWLPPDVGAPGRRDRPGRRARAGIAATRQLAKRQITWLRAQPERVIVDCLARDAVARTIDAVAAALGERA